MAIPIFIKSDFGDIIRSVVNKKERNPMLLYDYHTHTDFSDDSDTPMTDMVEKAVSLGIRDMAITDHYDPGYPDPLFPFILDEENYFAAVSEHQERYKDRITIAKGMEIGIMKGQFEEASRSVHAYPYDFIIGSFHHMRTADLYNYKFTPENRAALTEDYYVYIYECLSAYKDYDIFGHATLIDRYTGEPPLDYTPYMEQLRAIMKLIIEDGKGIELNTSSFKYGSSTWLPRIEVLKAYKELGGEILTVGSDTHETEHFMDHFDEAESLLTSLGFKSYCTFKDRKPTFHKFD